MYTVYRERLSLSGEIAGGLYEECPAHFSSVTWSLANKMYLLLFLTVLVSGGTVNIPDGPQGPPGAVLKVLSSPEPDRV